MLQKKETQKPASFVLRMSDEKMQGAYSNVVSVTVGPHDVLLDFAFLPPTTEQDKNPEALLVQRIIMTPDVAKRFLSAFSNAVLDFEKSMKA